MIIQTWVYGRHFSENELNEPITSRKKQIVFVDNYKIQAFKQKLEFWKTFIYYHEFESFLILRDFSDGIGGKIN